MLASYAAQWVVQDLISGSREKATAQESFTAPIKHDLKQ